MGLFRFTTPRLERNYDPGMARPIGYTSMDSSQWISIGRALQEDTLWACVDLLASSVASLPIDLSRTVGNTRQPVSLTPLLENPSTLVEPDVWMYQHIWSFGVDGNAWGLVVDHERGLPTVIDTVNPGVVERRRVEDGVPVADIAGKTHARWPHGDLWHVPGRMVPAGSWFALSPIEYGAAEINGSLAVASYGYRYFTDGGHPSAIVYTDHDIDPETAAKVKAAFLSAVRGREPAVFGSAYKYESIQQDPGAMQYIEAMRLASVRIARRMLVPPSMVYAAMSGESITYQNITQSDLHYLKHSLDRYIVRMERALERTLPSSDLQVKINRDALLRADVTSRYKAHEISLRNRWRSVNEVRTLEDEAPYPDPEFDVPGIPGGAPSVVSLPSGGE